MIWRVLAVVAAAAAAAAAAMMMALVFCLLLKLPLLRFIFNTKNLF